MSQNRPHLGACSLAILLETSGNHSESKVELCRCYPDPICH